MNIIQFRRAAALSMLPLFGLGAAPAAAITPLQVQAAASAAADADLRTYYRYAAHRPLWTAGGQLRPEAMRVVELLRAAPLDGMADGPERAEELAAILDRAQGGDPRDLARAEVALSSAWADYVQVLRRPVQVGITYIDPNLAPDMQSARRILEAAARAPSLARHIDEVSALNPVYAQLRKGLATWQAQGGLGGREAEQRLRLNLDRARSLPVRGRFVLVDAAAARLWLYDDGQIADSMKVIVGKPGEQTPMLAGLIRTAVLNPYWNVPPDLVRRRVAAGVLQGGVGFLKAKRYEVLADWSEDARPIDPETVDWSAVASGRAEVRVRQLPGAGNAMGAMKFMFPNEFGVYLHDTPEKALFADENRSQSSGCIRVEDAPRLARWLFGSTPRAGSDAPEQAVALPQPVPVYVNYFTAGWSGERFALRDDPYGRDRAFQTGAGRRLAGRK